MCCFMVVYIPLRSVAEGTENGDTDWLYHVWMGRLRKRVLHLFMYKQNSWLGSGEIGRKGRGRKLISADGVYE